MTNYIGTIVEESLEDNRIVNDFKIIGFEISNDENPEDRWHLYKVSISKNEILKLSQNLKAQNWYADFRRGNEIIIVFKNKIFIFDKSDKKIYEEVIKYGLSIGIPLEQLDFVTD